MDNIDGFERSNEREMSKIVAKQRGYIQLVLVKCTERYDTYNVENSVHHTGHGHGGTTATGEQERIFGISKLAAHVGFDGFNGMFHFRPHFFA
jgi:hypothetical protein